MNVLVVDDEPEVARLLSEVVERLGHACVTCGDVQAARRTIATSRVEAMALDLGLPGPDPVDWLETLARENPRIAARTVVITGGEPGPEIVARIEACGAELLRKPFRLAVLSALLLGGHAALGGGAESGAGSG